MSGTVGELSVTMRVDTTQLASGMMAAQATVSRAGDVMRGSIDRVGAEASKGMAAAVKAAGEAFSAAKMGEVARTGMVGAIAGIAAGTPVLAAASAGAMTAAVGAARGVGSSGEWSAIGRNMTAGMARGVSSGQGVLAGAVRSVVNAAVAAARSAAKIHSPSRRFDEEVGYLFSAGMASGISRGTPLVTGAMGKQVDAAVGSVSGTDARVRVNADIVRGMSAPRTERAGANAMAVEVTNYFQPQEMNQAQMDYMSYKINKDIRRLAQM